MNHLGMPAPIESDSIDLFDPGYCYCISARVSRLVFPPLA